MTTNQEQVSNLRDVLEEQGLSCSNEDLANFVRKDRLIKDIERLLEEGHTRSEIDKTVKQILAEKAKLGVH